VRYRTRRRIQRIQRIQRRRNTQHCCAFSCLCHQNSELRICRKLSRCWDFATVRTRTRRVSRRNCLLIHFFYSLAIRRSRRKVPFFTPKNWTSIYSYRRVYKTWWIRICCCKYSSSSSRWQLFLVRPNVKWSSPKLARTAILTCVVVSLEIFYYSARRLNFGVPTFIFNCVVCFIYS